MNKAQMVFKAIDGICFPMQNVKKYKDVVSVRDIPYGDLPRQKADLYYKPEILKDRWEVTIFIPNETIAAVYGVSEFPEGYTLKGNVYKCGDETEIPHFLTWNPVHTEEPDFHRPEYFGDFTLIG